MVEIPNNHLGCQKNPVNTGGKTTISTGDRMISEPSTVGILIIMDNGLSIIPIELVRIIHPLEAKKTTFGLHHFSTQPGASKLLDPFQTLKPRIHPAPGGNQLKKVRSGLKVSKIKG